MASTLPDLDDILAEDGDAAAGVAANAFETFLATLGSASLTVESAAPAAALWRVITPPPPAALRSATPPAATPPGTDTLDVPRLYAAFASAVDEADGTTPSTSSFAPPSAADEYHASVWLAVIDGTALPSPPAVAVGTTATTTAAMEGGGPRSTSPASAPTWHEQRAAMKDAAAAASRGAAQAAARVVTAT